MNALSVSILSVICILILFGSRHIALIALFGGALYLSQGHSFQVAGFSLTPIRIIGCIAFLRVISRGELPARTLNRMDGVLILLYVFSTAILLTRPEESAPLRVAKMLDVLFCYFACRGLARDAADIKRFLKSSVLLLVPYTALLVVESLKGINYFRLVGGSPYVWYREDSIRCFGSFRHPSLLGSVGATFFPLFVGLAFDKAYRSYAIVGAIVSVAIVYSSSSGGPLSAWATGVAGWGLWRFRRQMRTFRWGAVGVILLLALVMKAPVWYLLAKLSGITGGTGWHRAYLIDVTVQHMDLWWLWGMPLAQTHGWFPYNLAATGGADITNQYISFGLNAGIAAIVIFVVYLVRGYKILGDALMSSRVSKDIINERFLWGLGVMLTVHLSNWLGITYWDQFYAVWLLQMSMVASVALWSTKKVRSQTSAPMQRRSRAYKVAT